MNQISSLRPSSSLPTGKDDVSRAEMRLGWAEINWETKCVMKVREARILPVSK